MLIPIFNIIAIRESGVFGDMVVFKAFPSFLSRIGEEIDHGKVYKVKRIIYDFSEFNNNKEYNKVKIVVE